MKVLSEKQQRIVGFIDRFLSDKGYPPTIRDIQAGCQVSSTSVVDYNLILLNRYMENSRGESETRPLRSLLSLLAVAPMPEDHVCIMYTTMPFAGEPDWGVRADAVKVVRHWQELAADDEELVLKIAPVVKAMKEMLAGETNPYVLPVAESEP